MKNTSIKQHKTPPKHKALKGGDSVHEPVRGYTQKQIERIAATTNHVASGLLGLVTKKDLIDAVKYLTLEYNYKCSELSLLNDLLMLAARGKLEQAIAKVKL